MAASLAISNQEERDNFFRLTLLLVRVGNKRLREFFKSQWPIVYQTKTGVPPPVVPWNDSPNDAIEMNKIETKLAKLSKTKLKIPQFQNESFGSGNTNNWDFSLLTTVLIYSSLDFVTAASPESKAIKDMKEIRNKLIAHAPDERIPTAVFNTEWPKACQALKYFNATQEEFDDVLKDVEKPIDSLLPVLKECLSNEKDILDDINKLEGNNELRHRETLENIKQGNEDVKKAINEVEGNNELRHRETLENIKQGNEDVKKAINEGHNPRDSGPVEALSTAVENVEIDDGAEDVRGASESGSKCIKAYTLADAPTTHQLFQELKVLLDPKKSLGGNDYRALADKFDYTNAQINFLPTQGSPTELLLSQLSTTNTTLELLYKNVGSINRNDVIQVLDKYFKQRCSCKNCVIR